MVYIIMLLIYSISILPIGVILKIIGKKSEEIKSILGYMDKPEIIHKDNLVFTVEQEK